LSTVENILLVLIQYAGSIYLPIPPILPKAKITSRCGLRKHKITLYIFWKGPTMEEKSVHSVVHQSGLFDRPGNKSWLKLCVEITKHL
jgi:hypothetical protein